MYVCMYVCILHIYIYTYIQIYILSYKYIINVHSAYLCMLSCHVWPNDETVSSPFSFLNKKIPVVNHNNDKSYGQVCGLIRFVFSSYSLTANWLKRHQLKVVITSKCLLTGRIPKESSSLWSIWNLHC